MKIDRFSLHTELVVIVALTGLLERCCAVTFTGIIYLTLHIPKEATEIANE